MTAIGAAWWKYTENGKQYLSIGIDKELLPLAIREGKTLTLWEIPDEERKDKEKSPHYRLLLGDAQKKNNGNN
jgi:uncharacterized protein (DUF736 family)